MIILQRERERERETETETDREKERDIQTDRQTDGDKDRQTEIERDRDRDRETILQKESEKINIKDNIQVYIIFCHRTAYPTSTSWNWPWGSVAPAGTSTSDDWFLPATLTFITSGDRLSVMPAASRGRCQAGAVVGASVWQKMRTHGRTELPTVTDTFWVVSQVHVSNWGNTQQHTKHLLIG